MQIATFLWLIACVLLIARMAGCFFRGSWARLEITFGQTAGPDGRSRGWSEAQSAERRPERSPSDPAVCQKVLFYLAQLSRKITSSYPAKSPSYSTKYTLLSQKQRRYVFDSNVYTLSISIKLLFYSKENYIFQSNEFFFQRAKLRYNIYHKNNPRMPKNRNT